MTEAAETLHDIAAGWMARKRSGAMSAQEARDLETWVSRDPEHRAMLEHVEALWHAVAALRTDPEIMALRDSAQSAHRPFDKRLMIGGIAAALIGGLWLGWDDAQRFADALRARFSPAPAQILSTGVGQTITVTLQDGSIVTLDTNTRLRAQATAHKRTLHLEKGQAFFRVAKDASRPFVVSADDKTVTATGTEFNVRLDAHRVEVVLAQGSVQVEGPRVDDLGRPSGYVRSAKMTPGTRLIADARRSWDMSKVDPEQATSWRTGQLIFVRRPLGEVAAELNRYSEKKIIVLDRKVAAQTITGGFHIGDVDSFVRAIRDYPIVRVVSDTEETVELGRRT